MNTQIEKLRQSLAFLLSIIDGMSEATGETVADEDAVIVAEIRREAGAPFTSPDDWILVPREPTEAMIEAGREASYHMSVSRIYRAMVGAKAITAPTEEKAL